MADVPTGQQAQVAPSAEPSVAPATPPAPTEITPPAPPVPAGKTVAELAAELEEAKQLAAQANERASRFEHEIVYTRNLIEQGFGRGKPQQEETPTELSFTDDEAITSPGKTFTRGFQWVEQRLKAELEKEKKARYVDTARSLFETGRKEAPSKVGKLIQGIENEVANEIQQGVISGAIPPDMATDPDTWDSVAYAYRRKVLKERDMSKYFAPEQRQPMSAQHTETPTAGSPPKAEVGLTPEQEWLISKGNITREQFMESRSKVRTAAEERNR